jgi:hypothetical protein
MTKRWVWALLLCLSAYRSHAAGPTDIMPDLPKIIGKAAEYAVARARDTALEKEAGTVLISTLDGRLTALSSASGEFLWSLGSDVPLITAYTTVCVSVCVCMFVFVCVCVCVCVCVSILPAHQCRTIVKL